MKTLKKSLSVILAVLCLISFFSITSFAATKYDSYNGKYGTMVPVKSDYKTKCKSYSVNGDKGSLTFSFKSKGYKENVYYGLTVYSDEERQDILINKSGAFPTVNSTGSMTIDFSPLESGTYYGLTFTYIKKGKNLVVDSDSIYQFDIKLNKVGNITPKITDAEALYSGNYLEWKKVKYADFYRVYRKQDGGSWGKIADVTDLEYLDKTAVRGEKYIYTVKAYDESLYSKYNKNGVELIYLAAPKFRGEPEVLADNQIKISWNEVKGAEKYRVYRKSSVDSKYTRLATVKSDVLEYTDKTAKKDGVTYYYAVRAVNGTVSGVLSQKNEKTLFGVQKPTVSCVGTTVTVKWNSVENATEYMLFKKQTDGEWQTVYAGTDLLEFVDTDVKSGKEYSYSLVAKKEGEYSSFDSKGISVKCLAEPKISSISSNVDNSVYIKWNAVSGATKYNIYRESPFEEYTLIGATSKTNFYDTTEKGSNYFYTYYVEAVSENSVGISGNNTKMHLYMKAPELVSVKWNSGNIVKWNRVAGATSYKVYRKTPSGSYKEIAEVSNVLQFKDTTAKKSSKYYYTVAAMNGKYKGSYESGLGINCLSAPSVTDVSLNTSGGTVIKWNKISGATGYKVYRKVADGSWKYLGKTTSLNYTDKSSRVSGTEYFYTVRAYNSKGNGIYGKFGVSSLYLSMPVVETDRLKNGDVQLQWKKVDGAENYRIYRKTGNGSWKTLKNNFDGLSYTDTTAEKGTTYYYAVRAKNGEVMSGYKNYKVS